MKTFFAFFFLAACAPGAALAATDYFDLTPEQLLGATVISVSKTEERVSDAPAAVYVITQEDIARSGMETVPDLLRMAPGVNVARADGNTWAVSIRGFNSASANKLLVLVDGRTVYNPLFSGTFWEVQDLPLSDIERIEVVRGPGGTVWGANAVNGVINIITKNAKDTQGDLVKTGLGTHDRVIATARHGGRTGGGGYYRAYAKYFDREDSEPLPGGSAVDGWSGARTGFRYDLGGEDTPEHLSFHGDIYKSDSDARLRSYFLTAPYSSTAEETIKSQGGNIVGAVRRSFADGAGLKLQTYFDWSRRDQSLLQDSRFMFDIEGQYHFAPRGRHAFTAGGNYRVTADDIGGSSQVTFFPRRSTQILAAGFLQDKIALMPDRLYLTLGAKLEHNEYTGIEPQPNARLEWFPDERQTVWAAVSRAIRMPSRIERDLDIANIIVGPGVLLPGFPTEILLARNGSFDSEKLTAYEAGYRKQVTEDFSVDAAVFANDYSDLASTVLDPSVFVPAGADPAHFELPVRAVNEMTGEVYGAELAAGWKVSDQWKLTGSYAYMRMFLHAPFANGATQDGAEDRTPRHQAGLRSYWNITDAWSLDTAAYFTDSLPRDGVKAYTRVDANLGWKASDTLHVNLVGQNLLQDSHREFGAATDINTTQVPRSVFGKLTWNF